MLFKTPECLQNGILFCVFKFSGGSLVILREYSPLDFTERYEMEQEESSLQGYVTSEESVSPIVRMERFMLSDIIANR